ncbi:MAG: prepilin-type N-terminal cleavage/methylation domain-containing protein [Limisphaerales bacterium]
MYLCESRREGAPAGTRGACAPRAFSLIEILVTVALLSIIVIALMAVFNSTQTAFRASLTQTDVLESSRAVVGLITSDLEALAPSYGPSNFNNGAVNLYVAVTNGVATPLIQPLVGSIVADRTKRH